MEKPSHEIVKAPGRSVPRQSVVRTSGLPSAQLSAELVGSETTHEPGSAAGLIMKEKVVSKRRLGSCRLQEIINYIN